MSRRQLTMLWACSGLALAALACNLPVGGSKATEAPEATTAAPVDTPVPAAATEALATTSAPTPGCSVADLPLEEGPEHDAYYHALYRAASSDEGASFEAQDSPALDHASAPDAVLRSDGEVQVYYDNGQPGMRSIWVGQLTEGGGVESIDCIRIDGAPLPGAVEPDAALLPDGRVRLYFTAEGAIRSAVSEDGVNFALEGDALTLEGAASPSVTRMADGRWLLAVQSGDQIRLASGDDGMTFTATGAAVNADGAPELATLPDGRVRLYVGGDHLRRYVSSDGGLTWVQEHDVTVSGATSGVTHPSVVRLPDGGWVLLFAVVDTSQPTPDVPGVTLTQDATPSLDLTITGVATYLPTGLPDGLTPPTP